MTPEMKKQSEMTQLKKKDFKNFLQLSLLKFLMSQHHESKENYQRQVGVETSGRHKRSSVRTKMLYSKFQKQVNMLKGKRDRSSRMKLKILVSHMYNERVNLKSLLEDFSKVLHDQ